MQKYVWLAAAGGLGTLARYALAGFVQRWLGTSFPWGTALVNVTGCFLFGAIWALGTERGAIGGELRTVLLIGFLGAFTTYSTFVSETGQLAADAELLLGVGNIVFQVVAGFGVFYLGLAVGRAL